MYYQGKVLVHAQQHSLLLWTIDNSDIGINTELK